MRFCGARASPADGRRRADAAPALRRRSNCALRQILRLCTASIRSAPSLTGHLRHVEAHYARLFEHAPGLDAERGSLVFTGVVDDPETLATLRRLGFREPEQAAETIRGWHFGRRARGSRRSRARGADRADAGSARRVFGLRRSGRRARRVRRCARPDAGGGRIVVDPALECAIARVVRRYSRRRAAPRQRRRHAPARARRRDRSGAGLADRRGSRRGLLARARRSFCRKRRHDRGRASTARATSPRRKCS